MFKSLIASLVAKHFKKKLSNLTINEEDVNELLEQIKISLLDADVNFEVVKTFIANIKKDVVGQTLSPNQDASQYVINIIKQELVNILGKKEKEINVNKPSLKIMLVGLQGSGKTTTCAKLAYYFEKKHNKKPLLVGLDVYRLAAIEQLQTLAKQINCDFYEHGLQNPVLTADEAFAVAKKNSDNVIIFDTAGRLQTDENLMNELTNLRNKINPDEIFFVADGMSGQEISNIARKFNDILDLSGIIITKLDGDVRGGASLSLTSILQVPIVFIGSGEKISNLEKFYPERIADRILGLGDIVTLAEKAQDVIDNEKVKKSFTKMLSGKMDLEDLLIQTQQIGKMGNLASISQMIPMGGKISDTQIAEAEKKIHV
jgi:signal recognition particle subunit SRP54